MGPEMPSKGLSRNLNDKELGNELLGPLNQITRESDLGKHHLFKQAILGQIGESLRITNKISKSK